jgi:hypothetical protein
MSESFKIDALENCLQRMRAGESLEQVLASYPHLSAELRPMLQAVRALHVPTQIPQVAQARSRARLLAAAAQRRQRHLLGFLFTGSRPGRRMKLAWLALAAVLVFGAAGTGIASAQALPGDAFYSLKLATEQARLFLAGNSPQRLELEESFDRQRAQEVQTLLARDRVEQVTFAGFLAHTASGQWLVAGIRLQFPAGVSMDAAFQPGMYVEVHGIVQGDGSVLVKAMQLDEIEFSGRIQSITHDIWVINGISIHISDATHISSSAQVGDSVTVKAIRLSGDVLQAQWLEVASDLTQTASPAVAPVQPSSTSTQVSAPVQNQPTVTSEPEDGSHTPEPAQTRESEQQPTQQEHEGDHHSQATPTPDQASTLSPTQTHEGDHEEHATQTPTSVPYSTSPTPAPTQHDD